MQSTVYRPNGVRVGKNTPDESPAGGDDTSVGQPGASVSRRSYAGIFENLQMFLTQLTSNSAHNPNEAEFKSPAVAAWVNGLGDIHAADARIQSHYPHKARRTQSLQLTTTPTA